MDDSPLLLALDFGGTKLSAAVVTIGAVQAGQLAWDAHERHYSRDDAGATYEQGAMLALARAVLQGRQPAAVGISFGGPVDFPTGTVRLSHHVPGWESVPLRDMFQSQLGAPVVADNDANVAAVGEHRFGAGRGLASLAYVTVSTGIGSGWILAEQPWRGHEGMAGEIGHTVIDPAGPLCLCGKRGCVERFASGRTMAQDAVEHLRAHADEPSLLRRHLQAGEAITGQRVAAAAAEGDPYASEVLLRSARALGVGLGNAANLINPQRFILGGGVTKSGPLWWDAVQAAAHATALPEVTFDIVPAALGDDAPLWGAIALAQDLLP